MLKHPDLALSYTKFVGLKMKRIKNNYSNLISKDAKERLKIFILDWVEKEGKTVGDKIILNNYLTQEDIAQIICTSRPTASKLLNDLVENGIIEYNRKEIIIPNIKKMY